VTLRQSSDNGVSGIWTDLVPDRISDCGHGGRLKCNGQLELRVVAVVPGTTSTVFAERRRGVHHAQKASRASSCASMRVDPKY